MSSSTFFCARVKNLVQRMTSAFIGFINSSSLLPPPFSKTFTFPRPPDQDQNEAPDIPTVDVPDSPEIFEVILCVIYSGVEPPEITNISTLAASPSAADKYNIASMLLVLKG